MKHLLPLSCLVSVALFGACDGNLSSSTNGDPSQPNTGEDMPISGNPDMDTPGSGKDMQDPSGTPDMITYPASDCGVTAMYNKLEPTCATCHRGGNTPYFASADAFYNLIVTSPLWVTPGDPQNSPLIALLKGEATGTYTQMPLGADTFEDLENQGNTDTTIEEISTFITELDGCNRTQPDATVNAPIERKRARQIVNTLYQHLGLTKDDVLAFTKSRNYNDSVYPIYNPDDVKPVTNDPHISPHTQSPGIRWYAIGGGSRLYGTKSNTIFSPTFGQAITQVSQAWCGFSIKKDGNLALFKHVSKDSLLSSTDAQIRDNIKYLMLRFWGHVATDEEIDAMKTNVFDSYISPDESTEAEHRTAWTAVCATLIRDPMWLSY